MHDIGTMGSHIVRPRFPILQSLKTSLRLWKNGMHGETAAVEA
jgi:hypothetical protein